MRRELLCRADTAVTFQWTGHEYVSCGGKPRIGIRGLSEIALLDFDWSALTGRVAAATLILTNPPGEPGQLPFVTVSTIRAPWIEGAAADYALDPGASSYQFRVTQSETTGEPWAWPGSLFSDVVLGRGGSVWFSQQLPDAGRFDADDELRIDIPAAVVERCRWGFSHGLALFDDRGARDVFTRPCSRHTNTPPRLVVELVDDAGRAVHRGPGALNAGQFAAQAEDLAAEQEAAVIVTGALPQVGCSAAIGYRAAVGPDEASARALELWRIPEPPGPTQAGEFDLFDWPIQPGDRLFVRAVDASGSVGASTAVALLPARPVPAAPMLAPVPAATRAAPTARVAVLLPGESTDAAGRGLGAEPGRSEALEARWQTGDGALELEALAGEILDLPIVVRGRGQALTLDWDAAACAAQGVTIEASRAGFVRAAAAPPEAAVPDSLAPLSARAAADVPAADGYVELFQVDLVVAPDAAPGRRQLAVTVGIGSETLALPIQLTVLPAALPQITSFVVELNSYNMFHRYFRAAGDFAADEWAIQLDFHRQAHRHRCNFNVLPYSQMGTVLCDSAPPLRPDGGIADWRAWDARYLPLLTGAAFTDGPRAGLPVRYFYLPIHENWPGDMRREYRFNLPIGSTRADYLAALREHGTVAPAIEECFEPGYTTKLERAAQEFSAHLAAARLLPVAEGGPIPIDYFNNKHIYKDPERVEGVNHRIGDLAGTAWWLLDEPNDWNDYLALRFFGAIVREGFRRGGATIQWCLDLSRVEWDRDLLAGQRDLVRVSGALFKYPRLIRRWRKQGSLVLHYGSAQSPEVKPLRETVWAWQVWCRGGDGILPWSATPMEGFSNGDWLERPDKLSVIVPVREIAPEKPTREIAPENSGRERAPGAQSITWSRPSLRLKAFRRGQQDAELCRLACLRQNCPRPVFSRALLEQLGRVHTEAGRFRDEATSIESPDLTSARLEGLRQAVRRLAAGLPAAK
ncbi:MAG: hypothetical protein ACREJ2_13420 [Planctomycetota bacterium]